MSRRLVSRLPWVLLALHVLMTATGFLLEARNGPDPFESWDSNPVLIVIALIVFAAIGALVASRQPANPVGWLFLGLPLSLGLANLADQYARYAVITRHGLIPGGAAAGWLGSFVWTAGPASLIYALMLFPDGRLPGRRWRAAAWGAGAVLGIAAAGLAVAPGPLSDSAFVDNPIGIEALRGLAKVFDVAGFAVLPVLLLISLASLIVNYRRSEAEAQLRIKWFAYAAFLFASTMSVGIALDRFVPNWVGELMFSVNIILLAAGVGIGILRHRLFDIDLIIRRTVVYAVLVGLITGFYFFMVYSVGELLSWVADTQLAISTTAFIAIAFQPVRRWVQGLANRLVYGRRATPYEAMSEFSHRMAGAISQEEVLPRMAETAAEGIGAVRGRVRVFLPDGGERSASWPVESSDGGYDRTVEVVHRGERIGEIAVAKSPADPITSAEEKLLADLASQAGLALRNVRLTEDLRASRRRIVSAQDEERRRLERNLHDGAQQGLVALKVKLVLAERLAEINPTKARELLTQLQSEADETLENMRDLARGIYPPLLADQGLAAALSAQANKSPLAVEVSDRGIGRYPLEIEAAVYFCCLEAIQNASKYSGVAGAEIELTEQDGHLVFSARDNGRGFDPATTPKGAGLRNMIDRIDALSGTIEIRSKPGEGTAITGRLPL